MSRIHSVEHRGEYSTNLECEFGEAIPSTKTISGVGHTDVSRGVSRDHWAFTKMPLQEVQPNHRRVWAN